MTRCSVGWRGLVLVSKTKMREEPSAGSEEITALDVRVRRVGAERSAARVPSRVMELIAKGGHLGERQYLAVRLRCRVEVDSGQAVVPVIAGTLQGCVGVEHRDVSRGARAAPASPCVATGRKWDRVSKPCFTSLRTVVRIRALVPLQRARLYNVSLKGGK